MPKPPGLLRSSVLDSLKYKEEHGTLGYDRLKASAIVWLSKSSSGLPAGRCFG